MKKIMLSLAVIAIVAVGAIGATRAYFSDTKTSTGNTFTAGSINLNDGLTTTKFTFNDMKPGDMQNADFNISATSNPYWACMKSNIATMPENNVLASETAANDTNSNGDQDGELQNFLSFYVWNNRDNTSGYAGVGDGRGAVVAGQDRNLVGPLTLAQMNNIISPLADKSNASFFGPNALVADTTYDLGIAYCFGTFTNANGVLTCSGEGSQNIAQSDGVTGSTTFYAVQSDNNPNFLCSGANF